MPVYKDVNCTETALLFLFLLNPSLYYEISPTRKFLGSKIKIWPRYAQKSIFDNFFMKQKQCSQKKNMSLDLTWQNRF